MQKHWKKDCGRTGPHAWKVDDLRCSVELNLFIWKTGIFPSTCVRSHVRFGLTGVPIWSQALACQLNLCQSLLGTPGRSWERGRRQAIWLRCSWLWIHPEVCIGKRDPLAVWAWVCFDAVIHGSQCQGTQTPLILGDWSWSRHRSVQGLTPESPSDSGPGVSPTESDSATPRPKRSSFHVRRGFLDPFV